MQNKIVVGIDVSKNTLDYIWLPGGKSKQVVNSEAGRAALAKELLQVQPNIVILEATGGYESKIVESLHQAGIALKVVNPRQVRDFARSLNRRGKTDKLDARTVAEFGQSRKLSANSPKQAERSLLSICKGFSKANGEAALPWGFSPNDTEQGGGNYACSVFCPSAT